MKRDLMRLAVFGISAVLIGCGGEGVEDVLNTETPELQQDQKENLATPSLEEIDQLTGVRCGAHVQTPRILDDRALADYWANDAYLITSPSLRFELSERMDLQDFEDALTLYWSPIQDGKAIELQEFESDQIRYEPNSQSKVIEVSLNQWDQEVAIITTLELDQSYVVAAHVRDSRQSCHEYP